jgi:hypothetical protein
LQILQDAYLSECCRSATNNGESYLKEINKTVCKEWLEKIPADAGIYSKAQELEKKL